jgi:hypothetical protein
MHARYTHVEWASKFHSGSREGKRKKAKGKSKEALKQSFFTFALYLLPFALTPAFAFFF